MGTKEYILGRTVFLFNQQGEGCTSLRQIAAFLEMSDGNLRYHYKNKEELVLDLSSWMLEDLDQAFTARSRKNCCLRELKNRLRILFRIMYKYKFIFTESTLLLRKYKKFRKVLAQLQEMRAKFFTQFFEAFRAQGIFCAHYHNSLCQMLLEQFSILSDAWISCIEREETAILNLEQTMDHYIKLCLELLRPALTEKGLMILNLLLALPERTNIKEPEPA